MTARRKASVAVFAVLAAFRSGGPVHAAQWDLSATAEAGHESNVRLDSTRKSDGFSGEGLSAQFRPSPGGTIDWFHGYTISNRNYFDYTDANYAHQAARTGPDWRFGPDTVLETRYRFAYLLFPNDGDLDYFDHGAEISLKKSCGADLRLRGGFDYVFRAYDSGKTRLASKVLSASTEREDNRYSFFTAAAFRLTPQFGSHIAYAYRLNESNNLFQDYYDYDEHAVRVFTVWRPRPGWSAGASFGYEYRDYNHRTLLNDPQTVQRDIFYAAGASLKFLLTPDLALLYRISWWERDSNEPDHEYRDCANSAALIHYF